MVKEKVTLTLDSVTLQELRALVGSRSLSASVEQAIEAYVQRRRHLAAVDDWLAELERAHGPVPIETLEWAARLVDQWDAARRNTGRRRKRAS
jgi:predicted transcriptional regulator